MYLVMLPCRKNGGSIQQLISIQSSCSFPSPPSQRQKRSPEEALSVPVNLSYTDFALCPLIHCDVHHYRQVIHRPFCFLSYQAENAGDNQDILATELPSPVNHTLISARLDTDCQNTYMNRTDTKANQHLILLAVY